MCVDAFLGSVILSVPLLLVAFGNIPEHELIHEETPVAVHRVWNMHLDLSYSYQLVICIVNCLCYSFLERQSSNNLRLI